MTTADALAGVDLLIRLDNNYLERVDLDRNDRMEVHTLALRLQLAIFLRTWNWTQGPLGRC